MIEGGTETIEADTESAVMASPMGVEDGCITDVTHLTNVQHGTLPNLLVYRRKGKIIMSSEGGKRKKENKSSTEKHDVYPYQVRFDVIQSPFFFIKTICKNLLNSCLMAFLWRFEKYWPATLQFCASISCKTNCWNWAPISRRIRTQRSKSKSSKTNKKKKKIRAQKQT